VILADANLLLYATITDYEHGLTLCSTDHDFARFPSLRFENPIAR